MPTEEGHRVREVSWEHGDMEEHRAGQVLAVAEPAPVVINVPMATVVAVTHDGTQEVTT